MRCEHCDEMQEEMRQLRALLKIDADDERFHEFRDKYKLSGQECRVFIYLIDRLGKWASLARLQALLEPTKCDDYSDPGKQLQVIVHRIRRKTADHYTIQNRWSYGYKLEPVK